MGRGPRQLNSTSESSARCCTHSFSAPWHHVSSAIACRAEILHLSPTKGAACLLQERLQLPFIVHLRQLCPASNAPAIDDDIRDRRSACELAKYVLHLPIAFLSALIQFDERVVDTALVQGTLSLGCVGSVRLRERQYATIPMSFNLLSDKIALLLQRHACQFW